MQNVEIDIPAAWDRLLKRAAAMALKEMSPEDVAKCKDTILGITFLEKKTGIAQSTISTAKNGGTLLKVIPMTLLCSAVDTTLDVILYDTSEWIQYVYQQMWKLEPIHQMAVAKTVESLINSIKSKK